MADVCGIQVEIFDTPTSSVERPFKLFVKDEVFTIDSEQFRSLSPIFPIMCYGKDFENGRELAREIVDEKSNDIAVFLHCLHHNTSENKTIDGGFFKYHISDKWMGYF